MKTLGLPPYAYVGVEEGPGDLFRLIVRGGVPDTWGRVETVVFYLGSDGLRELRDLIDEFARGAPGRGGGTMNLRDEMLASCPADAHGGFRLSDAACPLCLEVWRARASAAEAKLAEAEKELESWRRYKANIDEALNSGDGSYRP